MLDVVGVGAIFGIRTNHTGPTTMQEVKFTKGPWLRAGKTVYALNKDGFNRFSALVQDAHTGDDELEANAQVMSAAPDMYEALAMVVAEADSYTARTGKPVYNWLDTARAALSKARGDQC